MSTQLFYRGEYGPSISTISSYLPSVSFGSKRAAEHYATYPNRRGDAVCIPRVMIARLEIERPVFDKPNDAFVDLDELEQLFDVSVVNELLIRHIDDISSTGAWENLQAEQASDWLTVMQALCCQMYRLLDDPYFIELCLAHGYDGAFYRGSGETLDEVEARVFRTDQIDVIATYYL